MYYTSEHRWLSLGLFQVARPPLQRGKGPHCPNVGGRSDQAGRRPTHEDVDSGTRGSLESTCCARRITFSQIRRHSWFLKVPPWNLLISLPKNSSTPARTFGPGCLELGFQPQACQHDCHFTTIIYFIDITKLLSQHCPCGQPRVSIHYCFSWTMRSAPSFDLRICLSTWPCLWTLWLRSWPASKSGLNICSACLSYLSEPLQALLLCSSLVLTGPWLFKHITYLLSVLPQPEVDCQEVEMHASSDNEVAFACIWKLRSTRVISSRYGVPRVPYEVPGVPRFVGSRSWRIWAWR